MASTGTIAKGCFGKVYKEKYNDTWAAVKRVPYNLISKKDLDRECQVYKKAKHPNIVKLLGDITLKDCKWVIPLEFIFGEDLETTIFKASKSKIQLTPENRGKIIIGMCEGLLHLHISDIVHQDLKPDNIMVEHGTHRAVIIDLGLAKFFRRGLNSAMDIGNEAYSAPEVLQMGSQRDQRSDVWAMGKIITELCARIRLYTPSVCPDKVKESLKHQPYCSAVCRMVETDPSLRASMAGVIIDIRRAGTTTTVPATTPVQGGRLHPPSAQRNLHNRSPSPVNAGVRDPAPVNISPSPLNRDPSPRGRDVLHLDRPLFNRNPSPRNPDHPPLNRPPLFNRDLSPGNRDQPHLNRAPLFKRDPSPQNRDRLNVNRAPAFHRDLSPRNRDLSPFKPDPLLLHRGANHERTHSPKADFLALHVQPGGHKLTEDKNVPQVVGRGSAEAITKDFLRMGLPQDASDLPGLPTTGKVVYRRFEEKDGQIGTWQQREVVTRDGKIVKIDDIKISSQ